MDGFSSQIEMIEEAVSEVEERLPNVKQKERV